VKPASSSLRRIWRHATSKGMPLLLSGLLYPAAAHAQSIGIGGCEFVAADCTTAVTTVQNQAVSISAINGAITAKCSAMIDGSDVSSDGPGKIVKCNFSNSQLPCTIATSSVQNVNPAQSGSCQTTCSVTVQQNNADFQQNSVNGQQNSTIVDQSNGNPSVELQTGAMQTNEWQEIIHPNGRVSLTCKVGSAG
jgi:hypothetical protein